MTHQWRQPGGNNRGNGDDNNIFRMFDPPQWKMPEQHISHRTATDRGGRSDNNYAKHIHLATACGQCAGHGFGSDANDIKNAQ
ncbi:hypothetical protein D3C72_2197670 [compost metagenome]